MTGAVLAALWLMLAPPPAPVLAPSPAPSQDVIQTQPSPAGAPPAVQPAPANPPPRPATETAPEEPQTPSPPDVQGQGAQAQQAWEQRLHAAYDTAEARQGPLDGRWKLTGPNGDALFVMVFSDPGGGNLVGAWRDLRRGGGADGSGFLTMAGRTSDGVYIRFTEPGQSRDTVLLLRPTADGRWGGDLTESTDQHAVVMTRF